MKPLRKVLLKVTNQLFQRQGFVRGEIIAEWNMIVGEGFAKLCAPEKITFPYGKRSGGKLFIKTTSSFAPQFLFYEPQIVERINTYFGYKAVERLSIQHGFVSKTPKEDDLPPHLGVVLSDKEISHLQETVDSLSDSPLKEVLLGLGKTVSQKDYLGKTQDS